MTDRTVIAHRPLRVMEVALVVVMEDPAVLLPRPVTGRTRLLLPAMEVPETVRVVRPLPLLLTITIKRVVRMEALRRRSAS